MYIYTKNRASIKHFATSSPSDRCKYVVKYFLILGSLVGANSMCPLHYCLFHSMREERMEFLGCLPTLFYKVDPPSPNVKRTRRRGRYREEGSFVKENPNPSRENTTPRFPRQGVHPQRSAAMAMAYKMVKPSVAVTRRRRRRFPLSCEIKQPWLTIDGLLCPARVCVFCRRRRVWT